MKKKKKGFFCRYQFSIITFDTSLRDHTKLRATVFLVLSTKSNISRKVLAHKVKFFGCDIFCKDFEEIFPVYMAVAWVFLVEQVQSNEMTTKL